MNDEILDSAIAIVMKRFILHRPSVHPITNQTSRTVVLESVIRRYLNNLLDKSEIQDIRMDMDYVRRQIFRHRENKKHTGDGYYVQSARIGVVVNHNNQHWYYVLADSTTKTVWIYDSLFVARKPACHYNWQYSGRVLKKWIALHLDAVNATLPIKKKWTDIWSGVESWPVKLAPVKDMLQAGSNDCAAYAFYFAAQSMAGVPAKHIGYCTFDPNKSEARRMISRCVLTAEVPGFVLQRGNRPD